MKKHKFENLIPHCAAVCVGCGLMNLKNEATAKAVRRGCDRESE